MSRNKANTKSGWKRRDAEYRKQQHERRKANVGRKLLQSLFGAAGVQPATPIDEVGQRRALKAREEALAALDAEPTDGEAIESMLDPSVQPFEGAVWDAEIGQWVEEIELTEVHG